MQTVSRSRDFLMQYVGIVSDIHKENPFPTMLDFFKHGFRLTDDDRFRDFRLEYSPWVATLCDWYEEPETDWLFCVQGSQTTKTTFLMGALLYVGQYVPGAVPCFWVQSTEDEADLFVSERLKPFLDEAGMEVAKGKRWKNKAFRVFNAHVKVGFATTKASIRSKPARFIFGDECGIWKETIAYLKKRTRTFAGKRKGFFGTTPPESGQHHSWLEATSGNFYQWWVKCPKCETEQGLKFNQVKWYKRQDKNESWNYDRIKETAYYECEHCGAKWKESQKLDIIQTGRAVCVDPDTHKPVEEKHSNTKTLQVSSLYSVFYTWGEVACDFLTAKASGPEALRIFVTDELAEVPTVEEEERVHVHVLEKFVDHGRQSGLVEGYDLYTAGVDVQRTGSLYYQVVGFKRGALISPHVLSAGKVGWKDANSKPDWEPLLSAMAPYQGLLFCVPIDATDGVEQQNVIDFCYWAGPPYIPLIDRGVNQFGKFKFTPIALELVRFRGKAEKYKLLTINSAMVKNDIMASLNREPGEIGSPSFPEDIDRDVLLHLSNEHRVTRNVRGRNTVGWEPRYPGAPQHYLSALVYATVAMEPQRQHLQTTKAQEDGQGYRPRRRRVVQRGGSVKWR